MTGPPGFPGVGRFRMLAGEFLQLVTWAADASIILARATLTTDDGEDLPLESLQTPNADRSVATTRIGRAPKPGYITRAFVAHIEADPGVKRGQVYSRLHFIGADGRTMGKVCDGYIYNGRNHSLGEFGEPVEGIGVKVGNEADTTLVNATAVTRTVACPTNARWYLYGGQVFNADDVARTVTILQTDGTNREFLLYLKSLAAATRMTYPHHDSGEIDLLTEYPIPMVAGDEVTITWSSGGASAGGTGHSSVVVEELIED